MSTWQEFYNQVRDAAWPDCASEQEFDALPKDIQQELCSSFGYVPGSFKKQSKLVNQVFPIKTATACQLKWNWSTVFLASETTASCHRTNAHKFDTKSFNFHNTPEKLDDRSRMLKGEWPKEGCQYCRDIEQAGGASDRITNLDFPGIHSPPELDIQPNEISVTPRILEIYFDNTCNLKCVYCGPQLSSLWAAENKRHGMFTTGTLTLSDRFEKSTNIEANKQKLFSWLKENAHHLTVFNILGGEPLYQTELEQSLDLFEQYPAPELKLQIFTNLNSKLSHLTKIVGQVKRLIDAGHLREFEVTASLDCWGAEQEYVRFPLKLSVWETNFEYLLAQPWINLIVGSTVTPLTIKTLPDLLERVNKWNLVRKVYHYQNSVSGRDHLKVEVLGDIFQQDFARALALKSTGTPEDESAKTYLEGIARQSYNAKPNIPEIKNLHGLLNELDRRRGTSWHQTFPWLVNEFAKYNLGVPD